MKSPHFRNQLRRLPRVLVVASLLGMGSAWATENESARQSLHDFFKQGVVLHSAKAKLVKVIRWPDDVVGRLRWKLPTMRHHPARISLIAEQGSGKQVQRWYIPVRVRWWSDAVVVNRDVSMRTLINEKMVKKAYVDVSNHTSAWWQQVDQVIGTRLTRPLQSGAVIYHAFAKRPPLLRWGDQVTIVAEVGGLTVRTSGKIMRQAGVGDRVSVRNLRSGKTVQATVIDRHQVKVYTGGAT